MNYNFWARTREQNQFISSGLNFEFKYFLNFTKQSIFLASSGWPSHVTVDDEMNEYSNLLVDRKTHECMHSTVTSDPVKPSQTPSLPLLFQQAELKENHLTDIPRSLRKIWWNFSSFEVNYKLFQNIHLRTPTKNLVSVLYLSHLSKQ